MDIITDAQAVLQRVVAKLGDAAASQLGVTQAAFALFLNGTEALPDRVLLRAVDIVQPDIEWVGGFTTCQKIAAMAAAANVSVILHGGGTTAFGQHFSYASAAVPWLECFVATRPSEPLNQGWRLPGQALPKDGYLVPSDAPGFGLELKPDWFTPFFV